MQPMPMQQPLFPGDCELQQLLHIFKLLGTPSEDVWKGVTLLRDWWVGLKSISLNNDNDSTVTL